jgi:peptidoglycan/LPS O-acetylase OafA/YrhL
MATFAASGLPVSDLGQWTARLLLLARTLAVVGLSAVTYQFFETRMRRSIMLHATAIANFGTA